MPIAETFTGSVNIAMIGYTERDAMMERLVWAELNRLYGIRPYFMVPAERKPQPLFEED
jgi:hypothetical protein